jgi:hypothetical protein
MDYRLELVPISVSDVDRARTFCTEKVGFNVDLNVQFDTTADTTQSATRRNGGQPRAKKSA